VNRADDERAPRECPGTDVDVRRKSGVTVDGEGVMMLVCGRPWRTAWTIARARGRSA